MYAVACPKDAVWRTPTMFSDMVKKQTLSALDINNVGMHAEDQAYAALLMLVFMLY